MLKFSTCYDSDPPDEVVRGLIEDEKKLFPPELRMVSPELPLPRVVRQQRVADPGNQRPGCHVGVTAHGLQGPGQEGFNLGGGRGIAFEEVTSLGHEGRAVRDARGESREVGAGIGRCVVSSHARLLDEKLEHKADYVPYTIPDETSRSFALGRG